MSAIIFYDEALCTELQDADCVCVETARGKFATRSRTQSAHQFTHSSVESAGADILEVELQLWKK